MTDEADTQHSGTKQLVLPVFYGSYRSTRRGIRLADYVVAGLRERGHDSMLIDAQAVGLPMLDKMYKEYPKGEAPAKLEKLAETLRGADGFVFVAGEYNWGVQPGLKNLTDHFLEEWFWRPAAIVSYSTTRFGGARASSAWHLTCAEMGMVVVPSTVAVSDIDHAIGEDGRPMGDAGKGLEHAFAKTADTLEWWALAARYGRETRATPF